MLKYSDLTQEQIVKITNGCGSKGGWINPPNFIFKASCVIHDFYYWRGCEESDRQLADNSFYSYMRKDIKEAKWFMKPYYHQWALAYYLAVRLFGENYFNYSKTMKTIVDI